MHRRPRSATRPRRGPASRSLRAISLGSPAIMRRPLTSRNASSTEMPSTIGVVSRKISNTALRLRIRLQTWAGRRQRAGKVRGPRGRASGADAERLGLVAGREHHPAPTITGLPAIPGCRAVPPTHRTSRGQHAGSSPRDSGHRTYVRIWLRHGQVTGPFETLAPSSHRPQGSRRLPRRMSAASPSGSRRLPRRMSVASPSGIKKVAASYECRITSGIKKVAAPKRHPPRRPHQSSNRRDQTS